MERKILFEKEILELLNSDELTYKANIERVNFSTKQISDYLWNKIQNHTNDEKKFRKRVSESLSQMSKNENISLISSQHGRWTFWTSSYKRPEFETFLTEIDFLSIQGSVCPIKNLESKIKQIHMEAIGSTAIEGSTILSINDFKNRPDNDEEKIIVNNYIEIMKELGRTDYRFFGKRAIETIHKELFRGVKYSSSIEIGNFRKQQNFISGGYRTCNPIHIQEEIESWIEFWKEKPSCLNDAILRLVYLHLWFEKIHPFLDGNGRTGRILMSYYLFYHKITDGFLLISEKLSQNRREYILSLKKNNLKDLIWFFKERIFAK